MTPLFPSLEVPEIMVILPLVVDAVARELSVEITTFPVTDCPWPDRMVKSPPFLDACVVAPACSNTSPPLPTVDKPTEIKIPPPAPLLESLDPM
jgi:hypothetical protein